MFTTPLSLVASILVNAPICLVWLVGLGMAWIQRHEQPKVAYLVSIALVILLFDAAVGTYVNLWMPVVLYQYLEGLPFWIYRVLTLHEPFRLLLQTAAWSLLLFTLFNWRSRVQQWQ